jgi:hypothetical protein
MVSPQKWLPQQYLSAHILSYAQFQTTYIQS